MANLYRENWPQGWQPNADDKNGDPKGLLRADNLTHDEDGVLSLIRGTKKISSGTFNPTLVTQIFGKVINLQNIDPAYPSNARVRYLVHGNSVLRNYSPGTKSETIFDMGVITGGGDQGAGFGFGFGYTFITYGTQRIKDDGINQSPLGMIAAGTPVISVNPPPNVDLSGTIVGPSYALWEIDENGSVSNTALDYVEMDTNPDTNRAIAIRGRTNNISIDAMALNGVAGTGSSEDIFNFNVRIGDSSTLIGVKVVIQLNDPDVVTYLTDTENYYEFEWLAREPKPIFVDPLPPDELSWEDRIEFIERARREFEQANPVQLTTKFNAGINAWTQLQCRRADFQRVGIDDSLNWSTVRGIKVIFTTTAPQTVVFQNLKFHGGSSGPLNGKYVYCQVDVQNDGFYTEKSLHGLITAEYDAVKASINVSPAGSNSNANECWIFRASEKTGGFYRVKRITGAKGFTAAPFDDTYTDTDALRENIRLDIYQSNLPDGVIGIVCNFKGRNWYITYEAIYPSYRDNYSSYDTRYVLQTSGNTEYNLFLTKLNNDTMVLATNNDFYEVSGSANVLIDGEQEFFDLQIKPLGIKSPAISKEFVVREGNLFYLAADGLRVLAGSQCTLLSNDIDLLFRNHTRHGIAPSINEPLELYYIGISKNQLYFSTAQSDNKRALYVYSFSDNRWRYEEHGDSKAISALFVEEDDTIIYGTALFGDGFLRQLDTGTLFDETDNIPFKFLTIYDHNQQPRNRKDSYTLKVTADTGNTAVNVILRGLRDDSSVVTFATTAQFNGREEKQFAIYTTMSTIKFYQLELNGTVPVCKIYNFSVDYDPRPEQLTNLRIAPSNFGVAGRKRIPEISMILDTLGNNITFTPIIDAIPKTPTVFTSLDKATHHHYFIDDQTGYDIGGLLEGGLFEFYELVTPREVEVLPDPLKFKFIPYTNLGSGSRKRFIQYAIVIDTRGVAVNMQPVIDGAAQPIEPILTQRKQTVIYTFDTYAIGVDVACILSGTQPFEFYEINLSECASEKLPPLATRRHIPFENLGTPARKKFSQFAFVIDTRGHDVTFVPYVGPGVFPAATYNTVRKETVIYTFASEAIAIDIGGILEGAFEFEYYGPNYEDIVYEKLPAKAQYLNIAQTNFGSAAKKRVRTIPMVINTFGLPVTYTPKVDGIEYPSSTFTTVDKSTVLHYFMDTGSGVPFGIDYGGILSAGNDFEFYGLLQPEIVEILPVAKKFDQFGPIQFDKVGKVREIRIRMVATGSTLNYRIFASDTLLLSSSLTTTPNVEKTYPISCPKGINPNIFRMEISSTEIFHRFDAEVRINLGGDETANKRITLK